MEIQQKRLKSMSIMALLTASMLVQANLESQEKSRVLNFVAVTEPQAGRDTTKPFWDRAIKGLSQQKPDEVEVDGPAPTITQADFPASYEADGCSATLVGPRVLLTAAHCFESNEHAGKAQHISVTVAGVAIQGKCESYLAGPYGNRTRDIAWCLLEAKPGDHYDTIPEVNHQVKEMDLLVLTGFAAGKKFTAGSSAVSAVSATKVRTTGRAWLEPGDSGGGMYKYFSDGSTTFRRIVAINSFVDVAAKASDGLLVINERNALIGWRDKLPVRPRICGVDNNVIGCL